MYIQTMEVGATYEFTHNDGNKVTYVVNSTGERSYQVEYANGATNVIQFGSPVNLGSLKIKNAPRILEDGSSHLGDILSGVDGQIIKTSKHDRSRAAENILSVDLELQVLTVFEIMKLFPVLSGRVTKSHAVHIVNALKKLNEDY